jgi:hypothetical protein
VTEEPVLDGEFEEYVETLFEVDYLEGVMAGYIYGGFYKGDGGECAAELIDLEKTLDQQFF